jgi:hypothetical protein
MKTKRKLMNKKKRKTKKIYKGGVLEKGRVRIWEKYRNDFLEVLNNISEKETIINDYEQQRKTILDSRSKTGKTKRELTRINNLLNDEYLRIEDELKYLLNKYKDYINEVKIPINSEGRISINKTDVKDYISQISIIFDKLTNRNILNVIMRVYRDYGVNFLLLSNRNLEDPLVHELNKNRIENVLLLLDITDNKIDLNSFISMNELTKLLDINKINILQSKFNNIIEENKDDVIEETKDDVIEETRHMNFNIPLPSHNVGYDRDSIPEFWLPYFSNEKLINIKTKLTSLLVDDNLNNIIQDNQNLKHSALWKSCGLVERLIPNYLTKTKLTNEDINNGLTILDILNINRLLCILFLFYSMLLNEIENEEITFIFKGGKAVQIILTNMNNPKLDKYNSEDIDLLVITNNSEYNEDNMYKLACHIGYLTKWILSDIDQRLHNNLNTSLLVNRERAIIKLSYRLLNGSFRSLVDIGFHNIPQETKEYFDLNKMLRLTFSLNELDNNLLFKCPDFYSTINEKFFYYIKYFNYYLRLMNKLPIEEEPMLTLDNCKYYLNKFKKSIMRLLTAETLITKERLDKLMIDYLNRFNIRDVEPVKNSLLFGIR